MVLCPTSIWKCNTLMVSMAKKMLSRNFSRIKFDFGKIGWRELKPHSFGLYVHVPFCTRLCSFCPFYKVLYDVKLKERYLRALLKEFRMRPLEGRASWLYVGGGTPNLLSPEEIGEIVTTLRDSTSLKEAGMEGNPGNFTPEYIEAVSSFGIDKISMGIETLRPTTLEKVNRIGVGETSLKSTIEAAQQLGISVNVDLMVGLPNQGVDDCLRDVEAIADIGPNQITIYPFLVIPGVRAEPSMDSKQMFQAIERSGENLERYGYRRENIWTFTQGGPVYDSSGDELVSDYLGFGPAAFSTVGSIQVVNPSLGIYLDMLERGEWHAFRSEVEESAKVWRKFAHEFYKLKIDPEKMEDMPFSIRLIVLLMRLTGNVDGLKVTPKGRYFVHEITKTVVESLPFPMSNPEAVRNWDEYTYAEKLAG